MIDCGNYGMSWFLSGDSSLSYDQISWSWCDTPVLSPRPTETWSYPSSCMTNTDCIFMTGILWNDLRLNAPPTGRMPLKAAPWLTRHVCYTFWTARHAWPLTSPLHITRVMHECENEYRTSVHWTWQCPSCVRNLILKNMIGGFTSARYMVRTKNIQLDVPC